MTTMLKEWQKVFFFAKIFLQIGHFSGDKHTNTGLYNIDKIASCLENVCFLDKNIGPKTNELNVYEYNWVELENL